MRPLVLFAAAVAALVLALVWRLPERAPTRAAELGPARRALAAEDTVAEGERAAVEAGRERARIAEDAVSLARPGAAAISANAANDASGLRILARILDGEERPLAGAELALVEVSGAPVARSGRDGRAEIQLSAEQAEALGRGPLTVEVQAEGHARFRDQRAVPEESELHLGDLRMAPGGRIAGEVLDAAGQAVAGARVVATLPVPLGRNDVRLRAAGPDSLHGRPAFLADWPETQTGADGRFELAQLRVGHWIVWAQSGDHPWSWSDPVAVSERASSELRLVLEELGPNAWIRGRILDPEGKPVAGVEVLALGTEKQSSWFSLSDGAGAFTLPVTGDDTFALFADPPVWEWSQAAMSPVEAGARDVELRFGPAEWLWVSVRDADGWPVVRGRAEAVDAETGYRLPRAISDLWDDGRARLHRPAKPFRLRVDAVGFRSAELGPFDPGALAEPIEVALERGPALRGRVLAGGAPLAGATVGLRVPLAEGYGSASSPWSGEGPPFVHALFRGYEPEVTTGADGTFALPVPPAEDGSPHPHYLIASAPGRATEVAGPFAIDPEVGLEGVELALGQGGSLRGTLVLAGEREPAGWIVRASNGLGALGEAHVQPDGRFLLELLRSGEWELRAFAPGAQFQPGRSFSREPLAFHPDVRIEEGRTLDFELAVPDRRARLEGRLALDGAPPGAWTAAAGPSVPTAQLDAEGRFQLELRAGETARLILSSADPRFEGLSVSEQIVPTAGTTEWSQDLRTGEVRGHIASGNGSYLALRWQGAGDLKATIYVQPDENGAFGPLILPAGPISVLRPHGYQRFETQLASGQLEPGGTLDLEIP